MFQGNHLCFIPFCTVSDNAPSLVRKRPLPETMANAAVEPGLIIPMVVSCPELVKEPEPYSGSAVLVGTMRIRSKDKLKIG